MQKTMHDVLGWQMDCINYDPCPLCYGCRNFDVSYKKCEKCNENAKRDVCNRVRHTPKALAMMINKKPIVVNMQDFETVHQQIEEERKK